MAKRFVTAREQYELLSPWRIAMPIDRTAAVHDQLMQIVAMADTTPWHPHIIEDKNAFKVNHGRGRDKRYVLPGKDSPLAMLDFTLHDKGEKHWKLGEGLVPRQHNEAYINSIIVHPEHQGKGIAQALIERLNNDHPDYAINPGVTTPKGYGLVQQLKKIIPGSEEKISPDYKLYVMDDSESADYEKSEYANVGHEDYDEDDYSSEYNPRSRQLVNASYDDGPYWGAGWDDEDEDDEDDWPEGTVPKHHKKKHATTELMNAPHYVGIDEDPYVGKHRKEEEPSRFKKWLKSWNPEQIAIDIAKNKRVAMAWDDWKDQIEGGCDDCGNGVGRYRITHPGSENSFLSFTHDYDSDYSPTIGVKVLFTNPNHRKDGVAESMMRRLVDDHPGMKINPGYMLDDGQKFHDKMLEKQPEARELVMARFWRTSMAWNDWAPQIQGGCDNCNHDKLFGGRGEYFIEHEKGDEDFHGYKKSTLDFYHDVNRHGQPQLYIQGIQTNPHYRNDGVAESLMRRLHEDHPDTRINPGILTDDGEEFYERMLEKEPAARDFTSARFWRGAAQGIEIGPHYDPNFNMGYAAQAWDGDKLVGHLTWNGKKKMKKGMPPEVGYVAVHPDYRRQGIGTSLINWARENREPNLNFNDWLSKSGKGLAESMGYVPKNWSEKEADDSDKNDDEWLPGGYLNLTKQQAQEDLAFRKQWKKQQAERKKLHKQKYAMPAPAPEGLRFQPGTPRSKGLGRVDAYVGDDPVGHLEWLDDDNPWSKVTPRKPGEVSHVYVHPNVRRQSVATEMFDHVKNNVRPDLHHSERRTNLGDSWVDYEQNRVASQRFWAMAWQDWAPHIRNDLIDYGGRGQPCPPGGECTNPNYSGYWIEHAPESSGQARQDSRLNYDHGRDEEGNPYLSIGMLRVHKDHRRDGVAEALMRRLVEDHPGVPIYPGLMTLDGQAFHDKMLQKEPTARDLVTARFWNAS